MQVVMSSSSDGGATARWKRWKWEHALQSFATIVLSLLLPLSFLLLARLSTAASHFKSDHLFAFLFLYFNFTILCVLFSLVAIAAFVHGLTGGRLTLISSPLIISQQSKQTDNEPPVSSFPRRKRVQQVGWLLVCTLLLSLELGIEFGFNKSTPFTIISHQGSINLISHLGAPKLNSLVSISSTSTVLLLFAVGLHETMLFWSKGVVKPVVEDTVIGSNKEEEEIGRWVERVGMGLGFGALWWWRLRDQLVYLLLMLAFLADDDELKLGRGAVWAADHYYFVDWWLYYLIVSAGVIRVVKGVFWLGTRIILLLFWRTKQIQKEDLISCDSTDDPAAIIVHKF